MQVSIFAALIAGLLSFLSPCVFPLVPGYVSMISGIGVEQLRQGQRPRGSLFLSALAFVIGFSVVFITFGASASAVGQFLVQNKRLLAPFAGAVIVLFGLHLMGWLGRVPVRAGVAVGVALVAVGVVLWIRSGSETTSRYFGPAQFISVSLIFLCGPLLTRWLNRDIHFRNLGERSVNERSSPMAGIASSFLLGFAFAFGWTPCIGPLLAAVLAMAATADTVGRGVFLLAVYSAGLAIPFLATALLINVFLKFYQRFRRYLQTVEYASGALLLVVGGLIFLNRLTWLSGKLTFLNAFVR